MFNSPSLGLGKRTSEKAASDLLLVPLFMFPQRSEVIKKIVQESEITKDETWFSDYFWKGKVEVLTRYVCWSNRCRNRLLVTVSGHHNKSTITFLKVVRMRIPVLFTLASHSHSTNCFFCFDLIIIISFQGNYEIIFMWLTHEVNVLLYIVPLTYEWMIIRYKQFLFFFFLPRLPNSYHDCYPTHIPTSSLTCTSSHTPTQTVSDLGCEMV